MRYALLALAATLAASTAANAHEPRPGPNGGTLVDAGAHHVELVATDTSVEVYLSDAADAPVPAPAKGAVQLTGPDGATSQAKFN